MAPHTRLQHPKTTTEQQKRHPGYFPAGPEIFVSRVTFHWSGRRESNPRCQLGKLKFYH